MRIFVCIKQVPDTETRIKLSSDSQKIETGGVKWIISPYDEFAIEEAIRFKESHGDAQVTAVTLGPKARVNNALLTAMAMGADDSILIDSEQDLDALTTAKALAAAIKAEGDFSLVFSGKEAIDDSVSAVGQMVAQILEIPHASVVSKATYEEGKVTAEREVEGGTKEMTKLTMPALIAANKGLNKPRFASLPGIMKAKKKPIKNVTLDDLGVSAGQSKVKFTNFALPAEKPPCKMIEGDPQAQVSELIRLLQEEAKVL
ncbi:MAG: electron transfer flavoprotein subunit beta/FixA family protein [Bdellovibrionales bacterium]|nr:electron transfer flavoprotein subunit beta/FixA family protein [Bdellovibrionales bacterium]